MSRVYFHSPSNEAALYGAERAWLGSLVSHTAGALMNPGTNHERLFQFISHEHYMSKMDMHTPGWLYQWASSYDTAFRIGDTGRGALIAWRGRRINEFTVALNTALMIGNDQMKLAARLHGQCELHAWVEGPNRKWLADIMEHGLATGLYRRELRGNKLGWEDVIGMLRERDDEPVVTSYSVCDHFPTPWDLLDDDKPTLTAKAGEDTTDLLYEWWEKIGTQRQWELAMRWLRATGSWESRGLELTPERWEYPDYHFAPTVTALDLLAEDYAERLNTALELTPTPA